MTQILAITEVLKLIIDWKSRGAWSQTTRPSVEIKALAVPLWKLFRIPIWDLTHMTEHDYGTMARQTRVKNVTDMISNLCVKLTGRCYGYVDCGECMLNLIPKATSGMPFNHKLPKKKTSSLSRLRWSIDLWFDEAINGDCDCGCDPCHHEVTAFQNESIDKPEWYSGE